MNIDSQLLLNWPSSISEGTPSVARSSKPCVQGLGASCAGEASGNRALPTQKTLESMTGLTSLPKGTSFRLRTSFPYRVSKNIYVVEAPGMGIEIAVKA